MVQLKHLLWLSFVIYLVVLNIKCENISSVDNGAELEIKIKSILPQNPTIGNKLRIVLQGLDKNYDYSIGHLLYNDELWQGSADSANKDTIYTFVPYIQNTNEYELYLWLKIDTFSYNLSQKYLVNNQYFSGLNVIHNDEGPIYKSNKNRIFPLDNNNWQIKISQDTVKMWLQGIIHDEAYAILKINFIDNPGGLPELLYYIKETHDSDGAETWIVRDTLKHGIIKIEDWNENGVYSGKVYAPLEPFEERYFLPPKTVFHCNKNN